MKSSNLEPGDEVCLELDIPVITNPVRRKIISVVTSKKGTRYRIAGRMYKASEVLLPEVADEAVTESCRAFLKTPAE